MAYIGKQPLVGNYTVLDALTATTTDTYALTKNSVAVFPQTPANCIVSLNGVIQAPFDSYTISGSNIVFASALTGSDSIDFITVLGDVLNVGTVSDGTIGLAKLSATGTPSSSTFLRGDNSWVSAGGTNTPAFKAGRSSGQTASNGTATTIVFDTEEFDTASAYDTATGTFTVPTGQGGKYFLYAVYRWQETATYNSTLEIQKNGSQIAHFGGGNNSSYNSNSLATLTTLSAGDAITIKALQDSGVNRTITGNVNYTYFLGYKIIE